jgi:outer membrane receptor protein involved in Fe transport
MLSRGEVAAFFVILLAFSTAGFAQSPPKAFHLEGVIEDPQGARIPGAQVEFSNGKYHVATQTDSTGTFQLEILDPEAHSAHPEDALPSGTITVQARGFITLQRIWSGNELDHSSQPLKLVLHPKSSGPDYIVQHVLVTATRIDTQLEDVPADSVAISTEHLAATPALGLDDVLREVPGFNLFRRNSSRTANPGTQGVSMRGLGASGASRALVLVDEVPLNDPFGGWVYWDRVARESVDSVELVRGGGGASLYGSTAMGGVIQFRTREPESPSLSVEGSWGNENTPELSLWTGTKIGPWSTSLSADLFRTDGYVLVPVSQRGPVDTPANSRHALTAVDLGRLFGDSNRVFVRGSFFDEGRHNGTVIQTNGTRLGDFSTGWNHEDKRVGTLTTRLFGLYESYAQTFSSVQEKLIPRDQEFLTDSQKVPSQMIGGNAQWSRPIGRMQTLVAGFEMRAVSGSSNEDLFRQLNGTTVPNGRTLSGGQERTARIFGEDILQLGPHLTANLSLGYDHWSDMNARLIAIKTSGTTITPYPNRTSDALNPRASLLYHVGHGTSLIASGYRAFRAPTLNELYRSFRQGNVFTQNNPALVAERLTGVEAGARQNLLSDRLNLRGTFFWNDVTDAIVNVTLDNTKNPILRQKQNVSRILSTGINLDGEFRVNSSLQFAAGYQFAHAVVSSYTPPPGVQQQNPSLDGNWIPQVPHQQFTLQTRYSNPKYLTATVQGLFVGQAYDDDQNQYRLDRYFTVNLYLSHNFGKGFETFIAAENLFNTRYPSAATPVTTLGPPLQARIGFRYQFPRR